MTAMTRSIIEVGKKVFYIRQFLLFTFLFQAFVYNTGWCSAKRINRFPELPKSDQLWLTKKIFPLILLANFRKIDFFELASKILANEKKQKYHRNN